MNDLKRHPPHFYMNSKSSITGSCLCGQVRYEIKGHLLSADHCHCSICRKQHGAAFASYADFQANDFKWVKGEMLIHTYETDTGAGWCFCSECGSSLAGTQNGKVFNITLGTLDGDSLIEPEAHIFTSSKADWHEISDDLPQYEQRTE